MVGNIMAKSSFHKISNHLKQNILAKMYMGGEVIADQEITQGECGLLLTDSGFFAMSKPKQRLRLYVEPDFWLALPKFY